MTKTLVVFFSRANENYFGGKLQYIEVGNTERVAHMIGRLTGADLFKLEPKVEYAADYKTCIEQAKNDLQADARPELKEMPDVSGYDEIYLGYPNYWGTMPMAVYTFLEQAEMKGKSIHPFCTHEGSGLSDTENDIAHCVPRAYVGKGLAILGSHAERCEKEIELWIKE